MAVAIREEHFLEAMYEFARLTIELAEIAENLPAVYFKRGYNDANTGLGSAGVLAEINALGAYTSLTGTDIANIITLAQALSTALGDKTSGAVGNMLNIVNP